MAYKYIYSNGLSLSSSWFLVEREKSSLYDQDQVSLSLDSQDSQLFSEDPQNESTEWLHRKPSRKSRNTAFPQFQNRLLL